MAAAEFDPANPTDASKNVIVLAGGYREDNSGAAMPTQNIFNDTWELRFSSGSYSWVQRTNNILAARHSHTLVFIPAHSEISATVSINLPAQLIMSLGYEIDGSSSGRTVLRKNSASYDSSSGDWLLLPSADDAIANQAEAWGITWGLPGYWKDGTNWHASLINPSRQGIVPSGGTQPADENNR